MKTALVLGAGGFIGNHLVDRLISEGYWVEALDKKYPEFSDSAADDFCICDLTDYERFESLFEEGYDEVYQLAADMGGATYINCGHHDADVMSNSVLINVHTAKLAVKYGAKKVFFPSSACVYRSVDDLATCQEDEVYPAFPDNQYGWEKLFSERMYKSYEKQHGLNVRIARFHSIVGPKSTWTGGKEKAHSALARKVAEVEDGGVIEVIGDGLQTRTFLDVEDCIDGVRALMDSDCKEVVNIGSPDLISINDYLEVLRKISNKSFSIRYIDGPTGVKGRECNINKIKKEIGWQPKVTLEQSTKRTYDWIKNESAICNAKS